MKRLHTDRSRTEAFQHCNRERWWAYEYDHGQPGMALGVRPRKLYLPLAVGGSVHRGLEYLLRMSVAGPDPHHREHIEDRAAAAALDDFAQYAGALDAQEQASEQPPVAGSFGDPVVDARAAELDAQIARQVTDAYAQADQMLYEEQAALVEAMVRAYAKWRLPRLLEWGEVLEVEREGQWVLADWGGKWDGATGKLLDDATRSELWFMSRIDALMVERASGQLYLISFKTTGEVDRRKLDDIQRDAQGLSESVDVEIRLRRWWKHITNHGILNLGNIHDLRIGTERIPDAMANYLSAQPSAPRVLGVRYEFLCKGYREEDRDLSRELGITVRCQRSPLIRPYVNMGMAAGDEQYCWAWEYLKPDASGESSKLNYRAWKSRPVWTQPGMTIAKWVQMLADCAPTQSGETGLELGIGGPAQAVGYTSRHPLDVVLPEPVIVHRNDDELRDWLEQTEAQEVEVAQHAEMVRAATDEGERRSLLNRYFPQRRAACSYPSKCAFQQLCWGGQDIRQDPIASGRYVARRVNHPQEMDGQ